MNTSRKSLTSYWCPHCGCQLEYIGFYRCTSCRATVDMRDFARPEDAAELRRRTQPVQGTLDEVMLGGASGGPR